MLRSNSPLFSVAFYERRPPHWQPRGKDIFLTWRLKGTLPSNRFVPPDGLDSGEAFAWIDRYLDKALYGPSWLRRRDSVTHPLAAGQLNV
jgi:hypothetical protein